MWPACLLLVGPLASPLVAGRCGGPVREWCGAGRARRPPGGRRRGRRGPLASGREHARAREADVVVVGAGLAGLVATAELADAGKRVILVDQEPEASLGGQAWWSFGGLFLVDSPEQRRLRVHDSLELARQDWFGTAGFDRAEDHWPRQWAEAYLQFAAGEKRAWLKEQGIGFFPVVGWAERGGYTATGPGNSVPRFHIVWGTGPGIVEPFARRVRAAVDAGTVELRFRHRVAELVVSGGAVTGVRGAVLEASGVARGEASSRTEVGDFEIERAGRRRHLGRHRRQPRAGPQELAGPARPGPAAAALRRARRTSTGRCSRPPRRPAPAWSTATGCGTTPRASPTTRRCGPATASGSCRGRRRCGWTRPAPGCRCRCSPASTPSARSRTSGTTGYEHTWFIATHKIVEKEFALSGSEQNPDLTGKDMKLLLNRVQGRRRRPRCRRSSTAARTSSSPTTLPELVAGMNRITGGTPELDLATDRARDRRPRPRDRAPVHQGPADHRHPRAPATTSATS